MTQNDAFTQEHMPSEDRLRELLVGKSITRVEMSDEAPPEQWSSGPTGTLTLSDGTVLKVWGNDGGCACSAGCYPLTELNEVGNLITNVEVEEKRAGDDLDVCLTCGKEGYCFEEGHEMDYEGHYRIFVYAENKQLLASFDGSDGNGYYGTGWWIGVRQ